MKQRRSFVNLIPLLDIIMIFLIVFMLTTDAETVKKAEGYDASIRQRDEAIQIQKDYFEKYIKVVAENKQTLAKKEDQIKSFKEDYEAKIDRLEQDLAGLHQKFIAASDGASRFKALKDELDQVTIRGEKAERARTLSEKRNQNLLEDLRMKENELYALKIKNEDIEDELQDKSRQISKLSKENERFKDSEERYLGLEELYEELMSSTQDKSKKIASMELQVKLLDEQVTKMQRKEKQLELQKGELEAEKDVLAKKVEIYQEKSANQDYAEKVMSLANKNERHQNTIKALQQKLENSGRENLQEDHETRKLAEWAKEYFWIIEIWLDREVDGKQPYRISDDKSVVNLSFTPKSVEDCQTQIQKFIKDHKAGGRSEDRVLIRLKAHGEASGLVLDNTEKAIVIGKFESFSVELVEDSDNPDKTKSRSGKGRFGYGNQ